MRDRETERERERRREGRGKGERKISHINSIPVSFNSWPLPAFGCKTGTTHGRKLYLVTVLDKKIKVTRM